MIKASIIAAIGMAIGVPTAMSQKATFSPIKFTVLTQPDYGDEYVIQKVWQTDIADSANPFSCEPQSIAYKDGIVYVPQNYYDSAQSFNLRRFDAKDGTELETIALKINDYDIKQIHNINDFSDLYFYLVNDEAGNLVAVIDVVFPGVKSEYPIFIGMVDTYDFSIPCLHRVNIKGASSTWGQLGHPQVFGNYASLFSDNDQLEFKKDPDPDFSIRVPISIFNNSKFESLYIASISAADIESGTTKAMQFGFGSSLSNRYSRIFDSKRDYMHWIDQTSVLYDTYSTVPFLGYHKAGIGLKMVSDFDKNGVAEDAKGINSFQLGNHRFLIIGNATGDRGDFILCSWDVNLPQSTNDEDITFDEKIIPYLNLGLDDSASVAKASPLSEYFRNNAQPWHLSNVVEMVDPNYTHTKDIHIYYPGSYLASYRIGKSDKFSGIGEITITKSDFDYEESYWTLSGIKLSAKPTTPGIYIYRINGKVSKLIIR